MGFLQLNAIHKSFHREAKVLHNISLTIEEGEFFVLVGPSGSGKSTLLKIIAGLEKMDGGQILLNGERMDTRSPRERNLSMVFQNYALYPHLTVEDNILFGLKCKGLDQEQQQKRLQECITLLGLAPYSKRKPKELSGGQRQRVALARSIVSHAPLCLMDEPLSNLDAKLRAQMRIEIKQLQQTLGLTTIYVTHDQTEAMTMGDRIMVLHQGDIQQIGTPLELYNQPTNLFVAQFIGSPTINSAHAILNDHTLIIAGCYSLTVTEQQYAALPQDTALIIGIRPEQLTIGCDFELPIVALEQLGHETHITLQMKEQSWTLTLQGQHHYQVGESLSLTATTILFFDAHTTNFIR
ncbi:ABC transporter ATP-binding protein [Kurthia sibirica]|uniref:Glycerol-3-phosphate ABC transporter ATP-binding protein n=1 Tax=Kurthia sibirica TaxID=202750 RepID=A0A2U3AKR0_9BACL|nr:ABC transporter ATP-binding protein [Kurthia sibirica]PWI25110.1 glycerol-3-phosphate ABC transporter ATP-binding protein [Kurthia sibirica]GEK34031.1 glycerol-3-phosphate ABC transporter ATP-binding protein [Kurthia sibirica]